MNSKSGLVAGVVCAALWMSACDGDSPPPTTPTPPPPTPLVLSAPAAVSPLDGTLTNSLAPTLMLRASTGSDATTVVSYEIQVLAPSGDVVYTRTVTGGAANGQATVSHQVEAPLTRWRTYRWRARAVAGSTMSPYLRHRPGQRQLRHHTPQRRDIERRVPRVLLRSHCPESRGLHLSAPALAAMEPELNAAGVILAKDLSFVVRGRLYLPTGQTNKYLRSVDVVTAVGAPWVWTYRGATICEFVCP